MADETVVGGTYIGSDKIAIVAPVDLKTPLGSEMVEVTFENGAKKILTKKNYETVVTDVPSDASIVRRTKFNALVPAVKALICEYDLAVAEIQPFMQELAGSIDNNFARATNFAWTKEDAQYIPNSNPLYDRTLLEAHAIILSIPEVVEAPIPTENGTVAG